MNQWLLKTELHRDNLIKFLTKIELPESGLLVEWFDADTKRNSQQNSLMWVSAYRPIANHLSQQSGKIITSDMVHAVCKDKFLEPIMVPRKDGTVKRYVGSTTKLGKKAFSDYLEQVYSWGVEMGVYFE